MTDYMICQNRDNHLLYALKHGRFWFWDKSQSKWVLSDFAAQQYAKAQTKVPDLTQEDWLGECFGILMDDYEVPDAVVKALRALPNKEETPCKVNTTAPNADAAVTTAAPAATLAEETSTTPVDASSCPPDPCSPADASGAMSSPSGAAAACSAETFDFSALGDLSEQAAETDQQFDLHYGTSRGEYLISCIYVAQMHALTAKAGRYGGGTWTKWYGSKGLSKSSAWNMLQTGEGFKGSTVEQLALIPELSRKDLNLIARNGYAAQLTAAAGDSQRVQDLLAQIKAEKQRADTAEHQLEAVQAAVTGAQESYRTAHKNEDSALRRAADAEQRAKEAEKQLAGARQVADAARMRADKYQREAEAAKAQPVAAAVDEDEINRRAHTLADELTAPLRSELEAAKAAAATPEQIELDTRNAYDSLLLAGRAMQNAWKSVKPQLAKLPPDTRAGAINQLTNTLTEIQTEAIKCL